MAVKGKVREQSDFTKEVGFFEGKVIAINPDQEELEKILGAAVEKEPEYLGEDKEGEKWASVVFWVRDIKTDKIRNVRFFLKDKLKRTQEPKEGQPPRVPKKQYINSLGRTTWADKEENLPDWFVKIDYRVANEGESELYNFLNDWLGGIDRKDPEAELSFDFKKLMRGNVRELREQIGGEYEKTVTFLNIIKTVGKEGAVTEYEQVYNKEFLPGWAMAKIRLLKIDNEFIDRARTGDKKKLDRIQKFVLAVKDPERGLRDHYILEELQTYDSSRNLASTNDSIRSDDTSY